MNAARTLPAAAVVTLLGLTASGAAPQEAQAPATVFRGTVDVVRVDVIVTGDDGRPVTDLVASDFEVTEDGKPQVVTQFKMIEIDLDPAPDAPVPQPIRSISDEEREAGREDVRLFVIYVPGNDQRTAAQRLVEPLVRFVRSLPPADMVTVVDRWTPIPTMTLTRDREATVRAIHRLADLELAQRRAIMVLNRDLPSRPVPVIDALEMISNRLGGLRESRQAIIFVGGGQNGEMFGAGIESPSGFGSNPAFSSLIATLKRNNTVVYAVQPTELATFVGERNGLYEPAKETGGRPARSSGIERALAAIAADGRVHYLVGYSSPAPPDGKFHRIGVTVRRKNVRVRARAGFLALDTRQMAAAVVRGPEVPRPVQDALASISAPIVAARLVRTWTGVEQGQDGRSLVTVVWEPLPGAGGPVPRRVIVTATQNGAEIFSGESPAVAGGSRTGDGRDVARREIRFGAPPGTLAVRVTIEADDGPLDTERFTVEVPDFAAADGPIITTPRVFVARTLPELRTIAADAAAIPDTAREFTRTDRLLIRFSALGPGAQPQAVLLNRLGQRMSEIPVTAAAAGTTHQIDLGLNAVPPGEYLIEVRASPDAAAGALIPFRIRG
jgi:VWFA-related protein